MTTPERIRAAAKEIADLLCEKNEAYGDSALNPAGIFSKLNAEEALKARIDDKLMRIKNRGLDDATEDTLNDLIGYFLLLKIARKDVTSKDTITATAHPWPGQND